MTTETLDFPTIDSAAMPLPEPILQDVAEIRDGTAIVKLSRTDAGLAKLGADLKGKTYDLTTTKGDKDARADRLRCTTLRTDTERLRKALKAPALEFGRLIDAEAKRVTEAVLLLEAPIDNAIKADEARRESIRMEAARVEAERVQKLRDGVAKIAAFATHAAAPGMTAERLAAGLEKLRVMSFGDGWQEFRAEAARTHAVTLAAVENLHAGAVAREAEAVRLAAERAELERQRAELEAAQRAADAAAKLAREAEQVRQAAEREALAVAAARAVPSQQYAPAPVSPSPTVQPSAAAALPLGEPGGVVAAPTQEAATLKLGTICERLGFTLTAAFVAEDLGVPWKATDKAAKLFLPSDFALICDRLRSHIAKAAEAVEA